MIRRGVACYAPTGGTEVAVGYGAVIRQRRSLRLKRYDYAQAGAYYVTIVTRDRACRFGEIVEGAIVLNTLGQRVVECWNEIPNHMPHVGLDTFVVMPNHVHGILVFEDGASRISARVGAQHAAPLQNGSKGPRPRSLGAVVRSFKSAATKGINAMRGTPGVPLWQRGFYEHVIRNEDELNRIRKYIAENPARWEEDEENPTYVGGNAVRQGMVYL